MNAFSFVGVFLAWFCVGFCYRLFLWVGVLVGNVSSLVPWLLHGTRPPAPDTAALFAFLKLALIVGLMHRGVMTWRQFKQDYRVPTGYTGDVWPCYPFPKFFAEFLTYENYVKRFAEPVVVYLVGKAVGFYFDPALGHYLATAGFLLAVNSQIKYARKRRAVEQISDSQRVQMEIAAATERVRDAAPELRRSQSSAADKTACQCPECGAKHRAPARLRGATAACRRCGAEFLIPNDS